MNVYLFKLGKDTNYIQVTAISYRMKNYREMSLDCTLLLEIPFQNSNQAIVAQKVLSPDPIMKPEDFKVVYSTKDSCLICDFQSIDDRILRVGVNSVIESIKTIIETMDELC